MQAEDACLVLAYTHNYNGYVEVLNKTPIEVMLRHGLSLRYGEC